MDEDLIRNGLRPFLKKKSCKQHDTGEIFFGRTLKIQDVVEHLLHHTQTCLKRIYLDILIWDVFKHHVRLHILKC